MSKSCDEAAWLLVLGCNQTVVAVVGDVVWCPVFQHQSWIATAALTVIFMTLTMGSCFLLILVRYAMLVIL